MPPNHNKFFDTSAPRNKSVPLLDSYCCRRCQKMKNPQSFSNKEIKDYMFKVANGAKLNSFTAQLCCRLCKGDQVHELQCEGPCSLVKVLDEFSKTQRTRGEKWCKQCIMWKEAAEPGVTTLPAPNGDLAPDEDPNLNGVEGFDEPEGDADSDDDLDVPYQAMSSLTVGGAVGSYDDGSVGRSNASEVSQIFGGALQGYQDSKQRSAAESSVSNPYEGRVQANTASVASWSVVDPRMRSQAGGGTTFHAYDSAGRMHVRQQNQPTIGQSSSQSHASSVFQQSPAAPAEAATSSKKANWAKPVGTRREQPRFPVMSRPVRVQNNYESDSEDDHA